MNEHAPGATPREPEPHLHEAYPAPQRITPDWRRYDVARKRFNELITSGTADAYEHYRDIDQGTARCISHVLGRALGRASALADFGRTGEYTYPALRDEYLALRADPEIGDDTRTLINWLGAHAIRNSHHGVTRIDDYRDRPVKLENLLIPTGIDVGDWYLTIRVPGTATGEDIAALTERLQTCPLDEEPSLRAFLMLPETNALSSTLMDDYHSKYVGEFENLDEAIDELASVTDRIEDVNGYAEERHIYLENAEPDYDALRDELDDTFNFAEEGGTTYVFYK